jgi:transcriptional regulator with XRE-family HTH domain
VTDFNHTLGSWIAGEREARSISQEALATQLGLGQPTLSKIEHGIRRMTIRELLHWAESLGVPDESLHQALADLRSTYFPSSQRAFRP